MSCIKKDILFYCQHCHKFYTIIDMQFINDSYKYITDFGKTLDIDLGSGRIICSTCGKKGEHISIEPWIRNLFFKIKGN